ncbi:SRPBCC family protein [Microbispora tritici]|uniref:SRPBCC family protein n=3 Tax=Streptosporangiaceae TaxID=2004 RepID=A0ABY3LPI6_9ACTN|nr:SRPBCC family protein [Microbispora fusca]TYB45163.1 SRPBCC family protein [Microbispora tritici]
MLSLMESATITGDIASVWETVSDPASWASWDPHVDVSRFEGDFVPGAEGWTKPRGAPGGPFKVVAVIPGKEYSTESPMPGGAMAITNTYEQIGAGQVRVTRRVQLTGWFTPVFKLFWAKGMARDMHHTFAALEQEAQRRAASV